MKKTFLATLACFSVHAGFAQADNTVVSSGIHSSGSFPAFSTSDSPVLTAADIKADMIFSDLNRQEATSAAPVSSSIHKPVIRQGNASPFPKEKR